jgi:hypothetical protein
MWWSWGLITGMLTLYTLYSAPMTFTTRLNLFYLFEDAAISCPFHYNRMRF